MSNAAHILVTGARGAIGRRVVAIARARGHTVTGIGHGAWSGDAELPIIDGWLNGDVSRDNLAALTQRHGLPDGIIHLAGGSHVGNSVLQPAEDFQRTVAAGQRLLEWTRSSAPKAKIVVASSAAVYGSGHEGPIAETSHHEPASPYGTHKAMVETMALGYARQFGLDVSILRLFSVYGPGLRKQLIWEVIARLLRGERQITLGGSGDEKRDFIEITDAASMLLDAAAMASPGTAVLNCGSGEATAVRELALKLGAHFPDAAFTFSGQSRPGDPISLVSDNTRARKAGLKTTIALDEGLARTVAWVKAVLPAEPRG